MNTDDPIRDVVSAQAEKLGLSAYAIAQLTEIDPGTVKRYLTGRCSLNSRYVSKICGVLNLELRETKTPYEVLRSSTQRKKESS